MVTHVYNLNASEAEAGGLRRFQASWCYTVSSKPPLATTYLKKKMGEKETQHLLHNWGYIENTYH